MSYAARSTPKRTLTRAEVRRLLRVTDARVSMRDHMLIAVALGCGLRVFECVALDVRHACNARGQGRTRLTLAAFKGRLRGGHAQPPQVVAVPTSLRVKLGRFHGYKRRAGESTAPDAPLFCSRQGRLSKRRAQQIFRRWAEVAELPAALTFHSLRHTFCQRLFEATRDIRLVQRAARHARLDTTTVYAGPSDDDVLRAVRETEC